MLLKNINWFGKVAHISLVAQRCVSHPIPYRILCRVIFSLQKLNDNSFVWSTYWGAFNFEFWSLIAANTDSWFPDNFIVYRLVLLEWNLNLHSVVILSSFFFYHGLWILLLIREEQECILINASATLLNSMNGNQRIKKTIQQPNKFVSSFFCFQFYSEQNSSKRKNIPTQKRSAWKPSKS